MKILIATVALLVASQVFALTPEERMLERQRLREEMHQKLRDSLIHGSDPSSAMREMDKMMEKLMEDSMEEMRNLSKISAGSTSFSQLSARRGFSTQWDEDPRGRTLKITPADKDTKLDVEVKGQVVSIKTAVSQTGQSIQTQTVPPDCDGDKVKMESRDGSLWLFFPFKGKANEIET